MNKNDHSNNLDKKIVLKLNNNTYNNNNKIIILILIVKTNKINKYKTLLLSLIHLKIKLFNNNSNSKWKIIEISIYSIKSLYRNI